MTSPWPNPPQLPPIPRTNADPTGLRYDRGDLDEQPTTTELPPGRDGWPVTGRGITVQTKACCSAVLAGERCDCRAMRRQLRRKPVIVMPAFNLHRLREQHVTAADLERGAA